MIKAVLKSSKSIGQKWANEMHISSVHHGISGQYREALWLELFRGLVPRKYALAQGVILIDSQGNQSKEVDLAIYDEQYIPYVFRHNSICYIPIEAVAAVVQSKSNNLIKEELRDWVDSIQKLKTNRCGIARTEGGCKSGFDSEVQTGTRPLRVLAFTKRYQSSHHWYFSDWKEYFDVFLYQVSKETPHLNIYIPNEQRTLAQWGFLLNCTESSDPPSEAGRVIRIKKECVSRYQRANHFTTRKGRQDINDILLPNAAEDEDQEHYHINLDLSGLKLEKSPNSWLTLNLQFNQLLMLRNNPMFFPHYAYARKFREEASVLKMNPKPQTDERKKNLNAYPIILQNYTFLNEKLAAETKAAFCHDLDAVRDLWRSFLRNIIPMKFSIDKNVVIIDSAGNQSEELDLVVYDEQYIPYVFQFHSIKHVPIEAVSVVVKLHDQEMDRLKTPEQWEEFEISLNKLQTSPIGIARFATSYTTGLSNSTQHATRPIRLFISTANLEIDQPLEQQVSGMFDFLLYLKPGENGVERFELKVPNEHVSLEKWAENLNSAKAEIKKYEELEKELKGIPLTLFGLRIEDNSLLTLNFQLNQLLMLINNPMLFPHYAYARQFRQAEREESL